MDGLLSCGQSGDHNDMMCLVTDFGDAKKCRSHYWLIVVEGESKQKQRRKPSEMHVRLTKRFYCYTQPSGIDMNCNIFEREINHSEEMSCFYMNNDGLLGVDKQLE